MFNIPTALEVFLQQTTTTKKTNHSVTGNRPYPSAMTCFQKAFGVFYDFHLVSMIFLRLSPTNATKHKLDQTNLLILAIQKQDKSNFLSPTCLPH